jgi:serine/threonine protein phosphatase 1
MGSSGSAMSIYAIGDVHGCAHTLDALLDEMAPGADDHLVFVGDYVDRGPRSRDVIDRVLVLEEEARQGTGPICTFLRGNHDQMMLDWIDFGAMDLWGANGGLTTINSYTDDRGKTVVPAGHVDFLRRTRVYLDTPEYCFVHAGMNPELTIAQNLQYETAETFLWTREQFSVKERPWEKVVVCGHTPQGRPLIEKDLIVIDTGCCFPHHPKLGWLSAISLPDRQVTSVRFRD